VYFPLHVTSVIISKGLRWVERVAYTGETKDDKKILIEKSENKRPLPRTGCRWEDNIKRDINKNRI
jgi:hypothetical protein